MSQGLLLRLLLLPSLTSGLVISMVSATVLAYSGWLYLSYNQVLYDYLFGAYGLQTFVWQNSLGFTVWTQAFMSSPLAYYLLVGAAAVIIGLAVFTFLQAMSVFSRGTAHLWREAHASGPAHQAAMRELVSRLLLRVTALVGWGVYAAFFVSSIVPFAIVLNQFGIQQLRSGRMFGALACAAAFLLLIVTLHLHQVFVRLTALRPRIFGGDMAIEEARAASRSVNGEQ